MLASYFLLPVLALASSSHQYVKRDAASINQAIGYIQSNITALNNTLNKFNKPRDSITAFTIQIQSDKLIKSVDNAANISDASAPLDNDESFSVASSVLQLQPNINSLLDNIVAHKPQFDTALFGFSASPLVKNTLEKARTSSKNFGDKLVPKLAGIFQQAAPVVIKQIDDKFKEAIAKFS